MNPYRQSPPFAPITPRKRSILGRIRSWYRRQILLWNGGSFRQRFPVRCPECNRRSWDPHAWRERNEVSRRALERMNYYRCGHRGTLRNMIRWG